MIRNDLSPVIGEVRDIERKRTSLEIPRGLTPGANQGIDPDGCIKSEEVAASRVIGLSQVNGASASLVRRVIRK